MDRWIIRLAVVFVVASSVSIVGCSQTAADKRAAKPNMSERLSRETYTGDVKDVGSNYVSIRQSDGETIRVRVNDRTKMDPVKEGDHVKAYVTDDGYASTIQRVPR